MNSNRYTGIQLLDIRMSLHSTIYSISLEVVFTSEFHSSYSVALTLNKL